MKVCRIVVLGFLLSSCVARANLNGAETSGEGPPQHRESKKAAPAVTADSWPAGDWSLAERSSWKRIHAQMDQHRNLMNQNCATDITAVYTYEAFRDRLAATDKNVSEEWNVGPILMAIRNTCLEGEDEKATVAATIREVVFARAPETRALSDGVLTVGLDLEANPRQFVNDFTDWLRSSL